jgi:RNA polymerase-binding transcription factor DksA
LRPINHRAGEPFQNPLMPALDLPRLRRRLAERAAALRDDLRRDRGKLADDMSDADTVLDRKDQADLAIQAGVDDAEFERDLVELAQVDAALERLDAGRYGRCRDCAEPIAPERLLAQPWAARCLACQARHEQRVPRAAA